MTRDSDPTATLPFATKLTYGLGAVAYGIKSNGFSFFLLIYYNQVLGLPERWVGAGILVALVLDAISDPIVGHLSDRLHSRWGRRHPFLYGAAVPIAVAYYFLWNPPGGLSEHELFLYFVIMAILVRTLITLYEVPCAALAPELTRNYEERTSVLSFRLAFGWWGGLTMAALAFLVFLRPDADHAAGILNPAGYRGYALAASTLMLLSMLVCAFGTHRHVPSLGKPPPKRTPSVRRMLRELGETLANRSFLALFVASIFRVTGIGLTTSLNFYLATFFWELGSKEISILIAGQFVSAAIALAVVPRISGRMEKKPAAILAGIVLTLLHPAPVAFRLLGWFPGNESAALLPTLWVLGTIDVAVIIVASTLLTSMIADVVEDSAVATGRRSEGVFLAADTFISKSVHGLGVFVATTLLAFVGFPKGATPGAVDAATLTQLGLVYVATLLVLNAITTACLLGYRIDRTRHHANLAELARRG